LSRVQDPLLPKGSTVILWSWRTNATNTATYLHPQFLYYCSWCWCTWIVATSARD